MDFSMFVPKNTYEWCLVGISVILLLVLFVYNKAVLKCKTLIESYVLELKDKDKELLLKQKVIDDYCTVSPEKQQRIIEELSNSSDED